MSASRNAARFVRCRPRPSMPRTQRETMLTLTAVRSTTGNSSSRASMSCCLESLSALSARTSRTPSASMSNRTAAATSGPARQPRPASSAPATKRTPSPRSYRNRRLPLERRRRALRAAREPRAGGLEETDSLRGPVGGERLADDPLAWDGPPEATVVGAATVVAHHEVMVGRNGDRLWEIAPFAPTAGLDEGLLLALAVEDHVPAADR